MKKLYRKGTVHPTLPAVSDQLLSCLPAAILTLTSALSREEREVLAYLISCSSVNFSQNPRKKSASVAAAGCSKGGSSEHPPCFNCYCFGCYMSYWVKWDYSSNRQLIHEIIDAFEENLLKESRKEKNKRERRKGKSVKRSVCLELDEPMRSEPSLTTESFNFVEPNSSAEHIRDAGETVPVEEKRGEEEGSDKGSVRKFVSFLGERIWGVWG